MTEQETVASRSGKGADATAPDRLPEDFHYVRVEATIAMAIVDPDGKFVGDNMVDATLVFGWRTPDPGNRSDAQINAALSSQMSPVLAVVSTVLQQQGWLPMGQTDDPMNDHSTQVGKGTSVPVRVFLMESAGGNDD